MNKLKSTAGSISAEMPKPLKAGPVLKHIREFLDGSFLGGMLTRKNIPFVMFMAILGGFYIANTYNAERTIRQSDRIGKEIKELKNEYISLKSELMFRSNQSQVAKMVVDIDLKEAKQPPHKLFIQRNSSN